MTRRVPAAGSWGSRLRAARNEKGWRQEELADQVGVTYFTVSRWELGRSEPDPQSLDALERLGSEFAELAAEKRGAGSDLDDRLEAIEAALENVLIVVEENDRRLLRLERRIDEAGGGLGHSNAQR